MRRVSFYAVMKIMIFKFFISMMTHFLFIKLVKSEFPDSPKYSGENARGKGVYIPGY